AVLIELRTQHADNVGFRFPTMDDNRQTFFPGQLKVAGEVVLLLWKRRVVPVTIEAGFADADDAGCIRQPHHLIPIRGSGLGDVVGLDADSSSQLGMRCGQSHAGGAGWRGRGDGNYSADARSDGALDYARQISLELLVVEVSMGVDVCERHVSALQLWRETRRASPTRRGDGGRRRPASRPLPSLRDRRSMRRLDPRRQSIYVASRAAGA